MIRKELYIILENKQPYSFKTLKLINWILMNMYTNRFVIFTWCRAMFNHISKQNKNIHKITVFHYGNNLKLIPRN